MMSKSILIIDDDKRLRELLEDYLKEKNIKFICVTIFHPQMKSFNIFYLILS